MIRKIAEARKNVRPGQRGELVVAAVRLGGRRLHRESKGVCRGRHNLEAVCAEIKSGQRASRSQVHLDQVLARGAVGRLR